jgi:hypothetical protein
MSIDAAQVDRADIGAPAGRPSWLGLTSAAKSCADADA